MLRNPRPEKPQMRPTGKKIQRLSNSRNEFVCPRADGRLQAEGTPAAGKGRSRTCCNTSSGGFTYMKKVMFVVLIVFAAMSMAMAQDVLGAHLVYGRGCVACHSPHSGARGNGIVTADATSGDNALWG